MSAEDPHTQPRPSHPRARPDPLILELAQTLTRVHLVQTLTRFPRVQTLAHPDKKGAELGCGHVLVPAGESGEELGDVRAREHILLQLLHRVQREQDQRQGMEGRTGWKRLQKGWERLHNKGSITGLQESTIERERERK